MGGDRSDRAPGSGWRALGAAVCLAAVVAARAGEGHAAQGHSRGHEAGLFLGVTDVDDRLRPTLGVDYEFRIGPRWGVGAIADWAFGGEGREFVLAAAGYLHLGPALRLQLAPGIQRDKAEREIEGVLRLGIAYWIGVDERWSVAPTVALDRVGGETIGVYGVTGGYRF
jgi:hypothetical protein